MTDEDLYPVTKDETRDRSKTYYIKEESSFRKADHEDDFDLETGEFIDNVEYHEKNEELAGEGEQGAAGGGGGGCGGGGGACGARAASQQEKDQATAVLKPCSDACKSAMSVSADPTDLLKGLVGLAGAVLSITDLLSSLIKPEMLSEMAKIVDSTQDLLAKSAVEAVTTTTSCCSGHTTACQGALDIASNALVAAVASESPLIQAGVSAAMQSAQAEALSYLEEAQSAVIAAASEAAAKAGDPNIAVDQQIAAITEAQTKSKSIMEGSRVACSAAMEAARAAAKEATKMATSEVTAIAVDAALATAEDSINDSFLSSTNTIAMALDVSTILGVV